MGVGVVVSVGPPGVDVRVGVAVEPHGGVPVGPPGVDVGVDEPTDAVRVAVEPHGGVPVGPPGVVVVCGVPAPDGVGVVVAAAVGVSVERPGVLVVTGLVVRGGVLVPCVVGEADGGAEVAGDGAVAVATTVGECAAVRVTPGVALCPAVGVG